MTVVILDTNALPHGHFNDRALSNLIEVAGRGAKVVVPEVVVWEWAEHARRAQESLAETIRLHRVDTKLIESIQPPEVPDIDELLARARSVLQGKVTVWSPSSDVWRDGLRQQVLQTGVGERKSEIKTGAADAIVIACVEHHLAAGGDAVVLITKDEKLRAACRKRCVGALVANGTSQLLPQLKTFMPAEDHLEIRAIEGLADFLNEKIADRGQAMDFDDLGVELQSGQHRHTGDTYPRISSVMLSHVDIAELHDFSVTCDDTDRYGLAELRIFGNLGVWIVQQTEAAPALYARVPEFVPLHMAHIDVTIVIKWNHNWQIERVEPTGVAIVSMPTDDELDADDVPRFRARALASQERTA